MSEAFSMLSVDFVETLRPGPLQVRAFDPDHPSEIDIAGPSSVRIAERKTPCLVNAADGPILAWPAKAPRNERESASLGGRIAGHLCKWGLSDAALLAWRDLPAPFVAAMAYGFALRTYAQKSYRTEHPEERLLTSLTIETPFVKESAEIFERLKARVDGVHLARDLVSAPPNILNPTSFAKRIRELEDIGVSVQLLEVKELEKLGMGALLAVGRGSVHPPVVAVMRWNGGAAGEAPLAFVGKGVTFDSGGLNIKPPQFMWKMKTDMGGAAAVVGAIHSLAKRRAQVNVVGIVGLVENMPSGDAYRPSDILKTYSGKTVEVIDTDNEGRLVLCDILSFAERQFKPTAIIDLATLTGGARMALGAIYAPLCSNDDQLAALVSAVGDEVSERVWRLPCGPEYDSMIASSLADMMNGRADISAHAIVAARFLARFVEKTPWAHVDMAATCVFEEGTDISPPGPSGFGVALLDTLAVRIGKQIGRD